MSSELILLLLGAAIGWIANWYWSRATERVDMLREHINDWERLSSEISSYWLVKPVDREDEQARASKVKIHQFRVAEFYPLASEFLTDGKLKEYQMECHRVYKIGLGGAFETADRESDPGVVIECHRHLARLVYVLRMAKLDLISGKYLICRLLSKRSKQQ